MPDTPRAPALDDTLALLREGYTFIGRRCDALGTDLFATRLMMTPVLCMRGAEAARMFYAPGRFTRQGAMPRSTLWLLQDKGSVQALDGAAHRHRKAMFMAMMSLAAIARAADLLEKHWREALPRWEAAGEVALFEEMGLLLTRVACDWAGVPLREADAPALAAELTAMIEYSGRVGPGTLNALRLRARTERRMRALVREIRAGAVPVPEASAAALIAAHRAPDGTPLDEKAAAVELINILRPTVAVGRFIAFAALALHENPAWRARFAAGEEDGLEPFVQEVRRFYPFFPMIGGRACEAFEWRGHRFAAGDWVLLDLYGTNHDPRLWPEPHRFRPERFHGWPGDPDTLVPQGAGDPYQGHRCPGEWITIALMARAVRLLSQAMRYALPPQDLSIRLNRMPAMAESGVRLREIRRAA